MNIVVLQGVLSRTPDRRELASGSVLLQFDLTTPTSTGTVSVPVAWFDPPPSSAQFDVGDEVVVTGEVRRRFFRSGGSTQTRTEVVAGLVQRASNRKGVARTLGRVRESLAGP